MSPRRKVFDSTLPNFVTITVHNWIDIFTRQIYRDILFDSINYCQKHKGLRVYGWCLMTNHIHLLITSEKLSIPETVRDLKKYTAKKIFKEISENRRESRRAWLLNQFAFAGTLSKQQFKFWKDGYYPTECAYHSIFKQKLDYIHYNPVKAGFVLEPEHWLFSSARAYAGFGGVPVETSVVDV